MMSIGNLILNNLFKNKEVISVTIVGSYTKKISLKKIGDIDVVVVCKTLSKRLIDKLISDVKKINTTKFKKKILVNSSFGPLKITTNQALPIHLMIYDVNSHIEHATSSPFTCFDWERSKFYKGLHLKEIYPVRNLQLRDFFESRRNFKEYLSDLSKNKISIRDYYFKKNTIKLKKKYLKIDARNRGEFVYHIIKFLVINLNKFLTNKNEDLKPKKFEKLFLKITQNDRNLLKLFRVLKKNKEEKILIYNPKTLILGKIFIRKYNKFINKIKKNTNKINFTRHAKTSKNSLNAFLGSRLDPDISNKRILKKKISKKFDLTITSTLKRSKSSAKFFNSKKIISNNLINEIDYGNADGMQLAHFKKKYPKIIESWNKGINIKFPNGESTEDVYKRVKKFLNFLKKIKSKKRILIISHSFFLRVLIGFLLNIDLKKIYKLKIDHLKLFEMVKINNKFSSNFDRNEIKKFEKQLYD